MWSKALVALVALAVPGPAQTVRAVTWRENAVSLRGQNGAQVTVDCPARGRLGNVWGTFVYTDDSSLCSAAVHAGVINAAAGGRIVLEIRAGEPTYAATTRNGVASGAWGAWSGSFVVLGGAPGAPVSGPPLIDWSDTATTFRGAAGGPISVVCPAGGAASSIWGTGLYTDDSSICTAAVHAGVISFAKGGGVTIALRPGAAGYGGSTSNGVTSTKWGAWSGSFVVLSGVP